MAWPVGNVDPSIGNIKYHNKRVVYAKYLFALYEGGLYFAEPIVVVKYHGAVPYVNRTSKLCR